MILKNDIAKVIMLLESGANPNQLCSDGTTPLHLAILLDTKKIIRSLLREKADVNLESGFTMSFKKHPLLITYISFLDDKSKIKIMRMLIQNGSKPTAPQYEEKSLLTLAMEDKNADLLRLLMDTTFISLDDKDWIDNLLGTKPFAPIGCSALHQAILDNDLDEVKNQTNDFQDILYVENNINALELAVQEGLEEITLFFLEILSNNHKNNIIMIAKLFDFRTLIEEMSNEFVIEILEDGYFDIDDTDKYNQLLLETAMDEGKVNLAAAIMNNFQINENKNNNNMLTLFDMMKNCKINDENKQNTMPPNRNVII